MRPRSRRLASRAVVALLALSLIWLSGCYDRVEVEDVAFILAIGFDRTPAGDVELISQIALPANSQGGGGGGGDSGGGGLPVITVVTTGKTVMEALRRLAESSSKRPSWSQARVVIFGQEMAKNGVGPVIDILSRNYETRRLMWVMVTPGSAREVLEVRPETENMPALMLSGLEREADYHSWSARTTLHDFLIQLGATGIEAIAGSVSLRQVEQVKQGGQDKSGQIKEELVLDGSGVFAGDKLVGWLAGHETRGLLWLRGQATDGIISFDDPASGLVGSVEIFRSSATTSAQVDPANPGNSRFSIRITADGRLTESLGGPDVSAKDTVNKIDELVANHIKDEALGAIARLQQDFRSDAIGLGELAREKLANAAWNQISARWDEFFTTVQINVSVDFKLRRHGMTENRLIPGTQR